MNFMQENNRFTDTWVTGMELRIFAVMRSGFSNFRARQVINKETPPHWRLLPMTCCSMFRRSQSTDFTCAVLQAVRILNICRTILEIQVPLNFLFKFTGINLVQLNINSVEFHLIRLFSFCNTYLHVK